MTFLLYYIDYSKIIFWIICNQNLIDIILTKIVLKIFVGFKLNLSLWFIILFSNNICIVLYVCTLFIFILLAFFFVLRFYNLLYSRFTSLCFFCFKYQAYIFIIIFYFYYSILIVWWIIRIALLHGVFHFIINLLIII